MDFRKICNVCGFKVSNLRKHQYTAHQIGTFDKFSCRRCGMTFTDAQASYAHAREVHRVKRAPEDYKYQCTQCNRRLLNKANLERHMSSLHGQDALLKRRCELCAVDFKTKERYERHIRSHTGEKPFSCPYCSVMFRDKSAVRVHVRIHTGEKPYACEFCSRRFTHNSTFRPHRKKCALRHTGQMTMEAVKSEAMSGFQ